MAVSGTPSPAPSGRPTTDVFEGGRSAATGSIHGPNGQTTPASAYLPGEGSSNKSNY